MNRSGGPARRWWAATAALLAARLAFAAAAPLGDDEGYYWVWSRHLAAGYHDHPPLVAWLVAVSTRAFGDSLLALRLPFVLAGTLAAIALRALVAETTGDRRLADRSALLLQVVPVYFGLGVLVIPDTPLLAFWLLAALAAWRAGAGRAGRAGRAALALGPLLGGALLSKYIGALLLPSLAAALLAARRGRGLGLLAAAGVAAALLFAPVVAWNAAHEWTSFEFQFAGRHGGARFEAPRLALYVASQALYLSPPLFALVAAAALRLGPWRAPAGAAGERYLWWLGVPTGAVFLLASAFTGFKPNWAAPGYLTLVPLALLGLERWGARAPRAAGRFGRLAVALAVAFTLLPAAHLLRPFVPLPAGADPVADTRGWNEAAARAAQAMRALRASRAPSAGEPFFAAGRYPNASRLEYHLPGRPRVVCLNPGRDAYDDWQDLAALRGRDFVFVASSRYPAPPAELVAVRESREFARVRAPAGPGATHEIVVYLCRGFGETPPARP